MLNISHLTQAETEVVLVPDLMRATGFALSGGGAKGSFEVGALKYLMKASGIHPDIITCTSVGAVNGMKLAEGEGPPASANGQSIARGLEGLEQIWLEFKSPSQMFAPSQALSQLPVDYYNALPMVMSQVASQLAGAAIPPVAAGVSLLTFLGPVGGLFLPFLNLGPAEQDVDKLTAVLEASSFFTLGPIASLYESDSFNPHLVAASGIQLLFATVGLSSGALRYVRLSGMDHQGNLVGDLVERDAVGSVIPHPTALPEPVDMKTGMLASAAAPFMFEPQRLTSALEIYTDGGVRELVPIAAAIARGAKRVFAIDCNAPYPAAGSQAPHQIQPPTGLMGIGLDVLAILLDEIDHDDVALPPVDVAWVWHIQPLFEAEGDMEIDVGAIRVNMDYGYMSAFDGVDGSVRSGPRRDAIRSLAKRIALARRDVSDAERCLRWMVAAWAARNQKGSMSKEDLVNAIGYHRFFDGSDQDMDGRVANLTADLDLAVDFTVPTPDWTSGTHYIDGLVSGSPLATIDQAAAVSHLQALKCKLQPLYDARSIMAGLRSVPPSPGDATMPDQPWLRWERPDESQAAFGDVWPSGPTCDGALDPQTLTQVAGLQVEARGTSGWAVPSSSVIDGATRVGAVQVLIPQGQTLLHVSGVFDTTPSASAPWLAPSGSTWSTTWQANTWSPIQLGSSVKGVSACPLPFTAPPLAAVARLEGEGGDALVELAFDMDASAWKVLGPVSMDGSALSGVTGTPALFMSTFAQQQSLELLVPIGDVVVHAYRDLAGGGWQKRSDGISFASDGSTSGPSAPEPVSPVAISCFQGNYGAPSNLEAVVAVAASGPSAGTSLEAFWYDSWNQSWQRIGAIAPEDGPLPAITGDPHVFQSKIGRRGDFELLVPAGNDVLHLFRDNDGDMGWKRRGNGVVASGGTHEGGHGPILLEATPVAVCGYQSLNGTPGAPNLEAIVRLNPPMAQAADSFETLSFEPAKGKWISGGQIEIGGSMLQV